MAKYLKRAAAVVLTLIVLDLAFGLAMKYVANHAKGGDTYNLNYINRHFNASLAIFGSSRANHHYVSQVFEDSLGLSAYNCGVDGNGILLAYCFLNNIISEGKAPQVVIYDFFPEYDLYDNGDHQKALTRIKPFYDIDGMKEIIDDLSENEYIKLHLGTYRYNSEFIQMLSDAVAPKQVVVKGYKPMQGTMATDFVKADNGTKPVIDPVKVKYLNKFIELCSRHSITLVFVTSPVFNGSNGDNLKLLRLYGGNDLSLIEMSDHPRFLHNKDLFVDTQHMNSAGAELFSSMLVDSLRSRLRP